MNTNDYFEEIGAWPRESRSLILTYISGFLLSLACTFAAYLLATHSALPQRPVIAVIVALACVQFVVQLVCFLHLGKGKASREKIIVLGAAALVVSILVSGSLWIMFTLNGRMMPSDAQMEQYMSDQGGF